jgi:hypothetical protein
MDFCDLITYQSDQNIFQSFLEHFNREILALQEAENFTVFITVGDGETYYCTKEFQFLNSS